MAYRNSHMEKGKGGIYHSSFASDKHRKMMWRLEKRYITKIIERHFPNSPDAHLDFACGTGRLLAFLEPMCKKSTGVDISEEMLSVAKTHTATDLVHADLTADDVLGDVQFDLITAFRFFPNAEPLLRLQALEVLVKHLRNNGVLLFNNHRNNESLLARFRRRAFGNSYRGMNIEEITSLMANAGLEVISIDSAGILHDSFSSDFFPGSLFYCIERLMGVIPFTRSYGYNQIIVCKRRD